MKLLIDLDEEYVKAIDKIKFLVGGRADRKLQVEIIKAIKNGKPLEQESTTKNDLVLIHTEGLDEEIRCTMCTNHMKSDRGCDGSCVVNKDMYKAVIDAIEKRIQPSVTPQEPKTGHWIPSHISGSILDECSECGFACGAFTFNYCPNCGCRMVEPQESEDT